MRSFARAFAWNVGLHAVAWSPTILTLRYTANVDISYPLEAGATIGSLLLSAYLLSLFQRKYWQTLTG